MPKCLKASINALLIVIAKTGYNLNIYKRDWLNKPWHTHIIGNYVDIRKNMVLSHCNVLTWKDVLDTLLNKSRLQKKVYIISNFCKRKNPTDMYICFYNTQRKEFGRTHSKLLVTVIPGEWDGC